MDTEEALRAALAERDAWESRTRRARTEAFRAAAMLCEKGGHHEAAADLLAVVANSPDVILTSDESALALATQRAEKAEEELAEWRVGAHADETGHNHRCARVDGRWSCVKECLFPALALATERARAAEAEVERANSEETKMHGECAKAWAENTRLLAAHRAFGSYLAYVGVLCCPECSEMWGAAPDPEPDCCDESRAELRKASDAYAAALPASDKLAEGPPAPASDPLRGAAE